MQYIYKKKNQYFFTHEYNVQFFLTLKAPILNSEKKKYKIGK